jgi:aspartate aminotransferase
MTARTPEEFMTAPSLSRHFQGRKPSPIRAAQLRYLERSDGTEDVNVAIGNVSLPMHPAMIERMRHLGDNSPFEDGVVQYTITAGRPETREAFLNILGSGGYDTDGLHVQITDGGSSAMELCVVGCCGPAGTDEGPLLLIDAAYTNYKAFANRLGRSTVSVCRTLNEDGKFSLPSMEEIEATIASHRPAAMVVIPFDNPCGQFYEQSTMEELGRLCVKYGMWMISDEAYRELHYTGAPATSIWALTEQSVPGITGRRIGIDTASKVWNACGLRIGALITDNAEFHKQSVAEYTASLCASAIGQWIFGALAHVDHDELREWYGRQRDYYRDMLFSFTSDLKERLPGVIVSSPDAAIYSVIDVRNIASPGFDALDFVLYCAGEGVVEMDGKPLTLLVSPMAGFYSTPPGEPNPGVTQMRVAYVEPPQRMALVPMLFAELFGQYEESRG